MAAEQPTDPMAGKHLELVQRYARGYEGLLSLGRRYEILRSTRHHYTVLAGDGSLLSLPRKHARLVDASYGEGL